MLVPIKGKYTYGYLFGVPTFYSSFHLGVDYVCPTGTPVIAPESGVIQYVGVGQQGGRTIHLLGASGALTRYLHLDTWKVKKGDKVSAGQTIGTVGSTGSLSTGPHLHFDVWTTGKIDLKGRKGLVDPLIWLNNDEMVTTDNLNGFLSGITGLAQHPNLKEMATALNSGDQAGFNKIPYIVELRNRLAAYDSIEKIVDKNNP